MTINDIIAKYYEELYAFVKNTNKPVYSGYTSEDIFHNALVTAINKYKERQIDEQEGYDYLIRVVLSEMHYSKKRISSEKLTFVPEYGDI